jgi:hypothetical protein
MDANQRAALGAALGQPLSDGQAEHIDALGWLHPEARRDDLIAKYLSIGRKRVGQVTVGKGDIVLTVGLEVGNALLDVIDIDPTFRHIKHLVAEGRLRADLPLTAALLVPLVGAEIAPGVVFKQAHADALLALALIDDPIGGDVISAALNSTEA